MIDSITEIVEIESPSFDAAGSRQAADWVRGRIASLPLDIEVESHKISGIGEHLLIRAFPSESDPVLIMGHTDTVHPVGAKKQNPTRIEDGKFFGCGIFDMKANIVLMIEALRFFGDAGIVPTRPINIFLSCDEEVGSKTGRQFVEAEAERAACCYVLEPSAAGRVKTGRKGTGMYKVNAVGIPSHAGLDPEKGVSSILELARQVEKLHSLNVPDIGTTVNVCTMNGGTTTNVIPEHAQFTVDVRFSSMAEAERIDDIIKSLKPFDGRVSLNISGGINRPPMERTSAVVDLYEKTRKIAELFGYELGETQVGGASDGNFVGAMGTPVLDGLGISGDGAHTLHEHILVRDIVPRTALVAAMLL